MVKLTARISQKYNLKPRNDVSDCLWHITDTTEEPMIWAAHKGHFEVVRHLHEHGADIHFHNRFPPLQIAAYNGFLNIVRYLHKHGADIHSHSEYAVRFAAERGHLDVVKYLHERMVLIFIHKTIMHYDGLQ